MNSERSEHIEITIIPLRDVVVYPYMVIPLFIGREKSIKCIESTLEHEKKILFVTQKESFINEPNVNDLFCVGTVASILQILKLPDGTIKVLVEGLQRARINTLIDNGEYFSAYIEYLSSFFIFNKEKDILMRTIIKQFEKYIKLNKKISIEILLSINNMDDIDKLSDTIASNIPLKIIDKQYILEILDITRRLEYLMAIMESEIDLLKLEKKIHNRVKKQMEKSQREYYLNEQIKAIQKELGESDNIIDEYEDFQNKINKIKIPKEIKSKILIELTKLKLMSPMSAEATVVRNYIDWMLQVPWIICSKIKQNIKIAQKILDIDHYGLDNVKERIIEYLAVQNRNNKIKGPILCFVGPPGVGKTSLGKSIARATGRKYIRMSLGGVRDEAEIRGHRRTYIGSMPGKIIQKIAKIGVNNPLFVLDEIDKLSSDIRGDPSSALLEVLDPEQNFSFNDNYLEIDYDLSNVMFVATSNSMNISLPLLDRMEVIRISGYTEDEKLNIANNYLIPKQIKCNSLKNNEINIDHNSIISIIRYYTRESGVRSLEREISKLCRKTVKKLMINKKIKHITINCNNLKTFLGIYKFDYGKANINNYIGQVTGLAWTEVGGELLTIETICVPGKGKLIYTGSLGKVMQESIQAALTIVRSRTKLFGINENFYEYLDIHVHVPEGAIPKDGPSAGIAMCTALVSSLSNCPVRSDIAMTGEITLRGNILSIGGLKEKLLAAHRGGIKTVLIPYDNKRNLENIPKNIISNLKIYPVKEINEVLSISLKNFNLN